MELRNYTPFSAFAFEQQHRDGHDMAVLAVRGTFHLVPNEPLVLADAQAPFQLSDTYEGDPARSTLRYCTDLTPYKPGTDLTVRARAHAPGGQALPSWLCSVALGHDLRKTLRVHGTRAWEPQWRTAPKKFLRAPSEPRFVGWRLAGAEPVRVVPLAWELAFGGELAAAEPGDDGTPDVHAFNPIGFGVPDVASLPRDQPVPAPRIEGADDPIQMIGKDHMPQGFAPVPPVWESRLQHAGTFDEPWAAHRHPQLPEDFDYRFYNVAAPGLSMNGFAAGDEALLLENLHPDHGALNVQLPGVQPRALVRQLDGKMAWLLLVLDGVHVDLLAHPAEVHLTWRCWQPVGTGIRVMELRLVDPAPLLETVERLKETPRVPGDVDVSCPSAPTGQVDPAPVSSEVLTPRRPWYTEG